MIAYALGASLLTGLLFGIVPALHAARRDSGAHLKEGGRSGTDGVRGRRVRAALAVGELAVALVLLVGAGLLVRSIVALNRQDPGFASTGVLTLRLDLPAAKYTTPERIAAFYEQLIERLSALPGVEAAGRARRCSSRGCRVRRRSASRDGRRCRPTRRTFRSPTTR